MDKYEKLEQLMADEAFVKELLELDTPENVQAFLMGKGIELSIEEIREWGKAIRTALSDDELDADALDNISGGIVCPWLLPWGKKPKPGLLIVRPIVLPPISWWR